MNNIDINSLARTYASIDNRVITMPIEYSDLQRVYGADLIQQFNVIKLANLKDEIDNSKRTNGARYYVPCGTAEKFISAYHNRKLDKSSILFNIYIGANDTQKTTVAVNSIINMVLDKPVNPWFDTMFYQSFRKPSRGRIISDPATVKDKIVPELKKWLPVGSYDAKKGRRDFESEWIIKSTGAIFDIMTYDQDIKEFESVDLDWCLCDEPPKRAVVSAIIQRFRSGGYFMFTMTPLMSAGFMVEEYINDPDQDNIRVTYAKMEDNCIEHGTRGIRPHKAIEQKASKCDPLEYEARVEGKFMYLSGAKYPMFNKEKHIIDPFEYKDELNDKYTIINVVDPHDRKPFALGWYLVELNEPYRVYTIAEYPTERFEKIRTSSTTLQEYVAIIKGIEDRIGKPYMRFGDPNYGQKCVIRKENNNSLFEELFEISSKMGYPIDYLPASDNIEVGHKAVQEMLYYNETIEPRLYFFKGLYNHVYAMTHYRDKDIDPNTGREKIDPDGKDFADIVRYMAVSEPWLFKPSMAGAQFMIRKKVRV